MARRNPAETPLMRQFLDIKAGHPDAILFFRLGDFYEMFFEDAVIAAKKLDLTLTTRDKGQDDAIPMCGVPHHAARGYIARLTDLGHKVVLCEQVEDPKQAKGLVKREVVRIITPGVVLDDEVLDPKRGRYLAAVVPGPRAGGFGLAYLDVSTGEFRATEIHSIDALLGELARAQPSEVLGGSVELEDGGVLAPLVAGYRDAAYTAVERASLAQAREQLDPALLADARAGLASLPAGGELATRAAADVVAYAQATQPAGTLPLSRLQVYATGDAVVLDEAAVANLELCTTLMGNRREGSLLSVIDDTCTAPGGRMLRRWLLYPLSQVAPIRRRQDAVEHLVERPAMRAHMRELLTGTADLERLAGRVSLGVATPRDLGKLRDSLGRLPELAAVVGGEGRLAGGIPELLELDPRALAELAELERELAQALVDAPPPTSKDGGFIRDGFCERVDEHRSLADGGKDAILGIETRERERTGIGVLKVKYNRVFGYYIEVTRAHLGRVPDDYVRKQTIANGERYVTSELAELESKILAAQEALLARELELFGRLCAVVGARTRTLIEMGARVATLDACASLAELAHVAGYVRPEVDDGELLEIVEGRHPVVERMVPTGEFVPNDCRLDPAAEQVVLITGPNMAGKSTYMRQVAHIVLLAQMGSFVPARRARIGLVDRIFTRVGASDNLARGESTFMVEMRETSAIRAGATRRSLVVLDEVGRGTSTFDGVSIAWAVTEFLHDAIGARTLFATHYHELCALAETRPRIRNKSVAVREHGG
ncbi:MAG TPA: DNA mismatch repair protein MutS, partial [Kofleriaceae bacterium]|nr:DNA mismatch repair protein MutS [Kofleriaceae bacterium]